MIYNIISSLCVSSVRETDSFIPIDFKSDLYDDLDDSQKDGDYYKVDIGKPSLQHCKQFCATV